MAMDDPSKSTDLLRLKETVMEHGGRLSIVEQAITTLAELAKSNEKVSRQIQHALFGSPDGAVIGCQERQRTQEAFLRSIKRLAWLIAAPVSVLAVGGIVAVIQHIVQAE